MRFGAQFFCTFPVGQVRKIMSFPKRIFWLPRAIGKPVTSSPERCVQCPSDTFGLHQCFAIPKCRTYQCHEDGQWSQYKTYMNKHEFYIMLVYCFSYTVNYTHQFAESIQAESNKHAVMIYIHQNVVFYIYTIVTFTQSYINSQEENKL